MLSASRSYADARAITTPLVAARRGETTGRNNADVRCESLKNLRDRITSVKNTKKITDAMKLVAAAKVRRAQNAVQNGRPFSENLVKVMYGVNQRLRVEDVDVPLTEARAVKSVLLVCCTGDRGLCGGFNNAVIKSTEVRKAELEGMGIRVKVLTVGKKGSSYFAKRIGDDVRGRPPHTPPRARAPRRPSLRPPSADRAALTAPPVPGARTATHQLVAQLDMGQAPTTKEAQAVADAIFAEFVSEEVDKVELCYTRFVSLISSKPVIQSLLPLSPAGEVCDVEGNCIDAAEDELFRLTTLDGQLTVERDTVVTETAEFDASLLFEQDPVQILDALLPLYLNSQVLRSLQESLASELAARMQAMNNASDNAKDLGKRITQKYQRNRQAKITKELIELSAGAGAV